MSKGRFALVGLAILALMLPGCSVVGQVLGMVPEEELLVANQRVSELEEQLSERDAAIADLQSKLDSASGRVSELEADKRDLSAENKDLAAENRDLGARNETLETIICSDHTWEEFYTVAGFWRPENWFDLRPGWREAFLTLQDAWGIVPEATQWTKAGEGWRSDLPVDIVVWDKGGMVLNVTQHCLVLDPTVYRGLGQ